MCGILGFINNLKNYNHIEIQKLIKKMTDQLNHRGPDSSGIWISNDQSLVFGHTRLSIQDLSENGNQPMQSFDKKYIISFNGEIYNHLNLRNEINRYSNQKNKLARSLRYRNFSKWNCNLWNRKFLKQIRGMFAFALWDYKKNILTLARDSVGEKPIYYGNINNSFVFSSELKSLEIFPNFKKIINREALAKFNSLCIFLLH